MYKLIGFPQTRTFRVMWMLEEIGAEYELEPSPPGSDPVRAYNPSGKIPVLIVDGTTLTDSTAIMTYLADKHAVLTHPPGTLERAQQDAITNLILDEFDALLWNVSRHGFILPKEMRVPEVIQSCGWEFSRNLDRLESRMEGPFLMGDTMTIADIIAVHCFAWALSVKFPIESAKIKAYAKGLRNRPAYQAAQARAAQAM